MKYQLARTKIFKKSFKKLNFNDTEIQNFIDVVVYKLANDIKLETKYRSSIKRQIKVIQRVSY